MVYPTDDIRALRLAPLFSPLFSSLFSLAVLLLVSALSLGPAQAAIQNSPLLTKGVAAKGSPASGLAFLNDGRWGNGSWQVSGNAWLAYPIATGPKRVLLSWNVPTYSWSDELAAAISCKQGSALARPEAYEIAVSANSTNGQDGAWTTVATVQNNPVSSRMHYVDFQGKSWIRLKVTQGGGSLDEVEVFDASASNPEGWIIVGNSITAGAFKTGMSAGSDFATLVTKAVPGRVPPLVRAGIPCIRTRDVSDDIKRYLDMAQGATVWGISLGTNDAYNGGSANLNSFKTSLALIVDTLIARGIMPVIARFTATNPAKANWQVDAGYLKAIDDLVASRNLTPGPDLYAYFLAHPGELGDDGVHPNNTGYASIQRLWAQTAAAISTTTGIPIQARPFPRSPPLRTQGPWSPLGLGIFRLDGRAEGFGL